VVAFVPQQVKISVRKQSFRKEVNMSKAGKKHGPQKSFWTGAGLLLFVDVMFYPALKLLPLNKLGRDLYQACQSSLVDTRVPKDTRTDLKVWVSKRSGFYYCANSQQYGILTPGEFMAQAEAVQRGFRPAANLGCTGLRTIKK
jgi:hypothetical protein